MSRIQINNLECDQNELRDLSPQELLIQGGRWKIFKYIAAIAIAYVSPIVITF
jgi:hypothetical protein